AGTAQPARAHRARAHHYRDAGDDVGAVRQEQGHAARPCARPDRRGGMDSPDQATLRGSAAGDFRAMTTLMLGWAITVAQILLGLAMMCAAYRVLAGPRAQDRVLGLDTLYMNAMLLLLTFGIQ